METELFQLLDLHPLKQVIMSVDLKDGMKDWMMEIKKYLLELHLVYL